MESSLEQSASICIIKQSEPKFVLDSGLFALVAAHKLTLFAAFKMFESESYFICYYL